LAFLSNGYSPLCRSGGIYLPQKIQELLIDLGRGFMVKPVVRAVDFDTSNKTRKPDASSSSVR